MVDFKLLFLLLLPLICVCFAEEEKMERPEGFKLIEEMDFAKYMFVYEEEAMKVHELTDENFTNVIDDNGKMCRVILLTERFCEFCTNMTMMMEEFAANQGKHRCMIYTLNKSNNPRSTDALPVVGRAPGVVILMNNTYSRVPPRYFSNSESLSKGIYNRVTSLEESRTRGSFLTYTPPLPAWRYHLNEGFSILRRTPFIRDIDSLQQKILSNPSGWLDRHIWQSFAACTAAGFVFAAFVTCCFCGPSKKAKTNAQDTVNSVVLKEKEDKVEEKVEEEEEKAEEKEKVEKEKKKVEEKKEVRHGMMTRRRKAKKE